MLGDIFDTRDPVSLYQPSEDVKEVTNVVRHDFQIGQMILDRPWPELNNLSVLDDEQRGQQMFNAFVDESTDDPAEAWKWRGTRSKARNKGIAMHAQLTANYLVPIYEAMNDDNENEEAFSEFMRDIVEWMTYPQNSDYQPAFLSVSLGMLENPVTYLGAEFFEVYEKVKVKQEDGKISTQEMLDEINSGFKCPVWTTSQVLISNAYERNIQRQRFVITRRYTYKENLAPKYKDHPNWEFVTPGIKTIYQQDTGLFYDVKDQVLQPFLCEETIYKRRADDVEIPFVNGIYLGDENVDANPIAHRDNRNAPKYNITPFGYQRIGQHFFFYKSMMSSLRWDNQLYDAMSEIVMNRALLEQNMPIAVSGTDKIDTQIIFPGAVAAFEDKDTKVTPILPPANFAAGFKALDETDASMSEGSLSGMASGSLPGASTRAYIFAQANANAQKMIEQVAKSLSESVVAYGDLMKDIAIQHITIPETLDIVGKGVSLKYPTFLLPNKSVNGVVAHKQLKFGAELLGRQETEQQRESRNVKLLEQTGYPDVKKHLYIINPELFAKFRYYAKVDLKKMFPPGDETMQAMLTNLYELLAQDPLVNREQILHKLLYSYFQSEADAMIQKPEAQPGLNPMQPAQPAQPMQPAPAPGTTSTQGGQIFKSRQLSTALGGQGR